MATVVLLVLSVGALMWMKEERRGPFALPERAAPVVVFVVIDTLRADRTSLCGYRHPTTPTLERLVEEGATAACESHSPSTWTLPSHASFFTGVGLDVHQSGSGGGSEPMKWGTVTPLGPDLPTVAEELKARGYQTLLLSGNPVVAERMGLTRGFEHVAIGRRYEMMHDHRLAERLLGLLRVAKLDPALPLFAFINIADPHSPWRPIPEDAGFLPPREGLTINPGRKRYESGQMSDDEAQQWLQHLSDVYDYAVLRSDRSLRRVLGVLERAGWLDQHYRLVITSDHGEYLGEHQMVEHGRDHLYEPVTRVPFLYFSTEGTPELPDDLPAIAAHALVRDGELPDPMPSRFAAAFRDQPAARRENPIPCTYGQAALWAGDTKLVANRGSVTRFDLGADRGELVPARAGDDPGAAQLLGHCRALDRAYVTRPAIAPELETALTEQLKALGYLQDQAAPAEPPDEP